MSRNKNTSESTSAAEPVTAKSVLVDYRGTVGRASRQAEIEHKRSPLILWFPKAEIPSVSLQPGLNIVDATVFEFYVEHAVQVRTMVDDGRLTKLEALPRDSRAMVDLVSRTIDRKALAWINDQEEARGMPREQVLDAITRRAAKGTPVIIEPRVYAPVIPMGPRGNSGQSAAMG